MNDSLAHIEEVMESADCLYTEQQLVAAVARLSEAICADMETLNPLVLCVMNGGLITAGQLLPRLPFLLELDYLHATRYRNTTVGDSVHWLVKPRASLSGRHILLVDDIFDEGMTLADIQQFCRHQGAASVRTAVLVEKQHARKAPDVFVDYVAVRVPDRYVFGFGMDYRGYLRNIPGIYAIKQ